ncbi:MAG: hypothetical protein HFH49_14250 [Lachnospiraceae bacterium]|nr:hypothetical protein [Lachnospiraceae bacterium]
MKTKMKGIAKRIAVTAIAVAVVFGSIQTASVTAEAKGTAFINKKTSKVTPTVKSAKRLGGGKVAVTVSVPANKVKKLGKVKKITVAYGSTKNSKKFEAYKGQAKVTKKGKNQYTFTISSTKFQGSKRSAYLTVRFSGKTNWSKLVKVSGRDNATYYLQCECGKTWSGTNGYEELMKLFTIHGEEESAKESSTNDPNETITLEDIINETGGCLHTGYKTWVTGSISSN